jgi:hypothetical protein
MKSNRPTAAICWMVFVLMAWSSTLSAQASEFRLQEPARFTQRETLRDLKGLAVSVLIDADFVLQGLTQNNLQTSVELRLRRSGVPVVSAQEAAQLAGNPVLYLNVSLLKSTLLYVYSVDLHLQQQISLKRLPSVEAQTPTWRTSLLGFVTSIGDPSAKLQQSIDNLVDRFLNDYLAVNLK